MGNMVKGLRRAFHPSNLLISLVVFAASLVMVRLGFWQLARLEQRRAYNARVLAQIQAPPLDLNQNPFLDEPAETYRYRQAIARGRFDPEGEILVRNRFYQGRPGYRVLTPLLLTEWEGVAVLVDRGWLPEPLESVSPPPTGAVVVEGFLRPGEAAPEGASFPPNEPWFWIDLQALDARLPYQLLPAYLVQTPSGNQSENETLIREPLQVELTEGPHLGYAIQWFLFASVLPLVYLHQLGKEKGRPSKDRPTESEGSPPD